MRKIFGNDDRKNVHAYDDSENTFEKTEWTEYGEQNDDFSFQSLLLSILSLIL